MFAGQEEREGGKKESMFEKELEQGKTRWWRSRDQTVRQCRGQVHHLPELGVKAATDIVLIF